MALIDIPLNSFVYRFRPLTWVEQARITFPTDEDPNDVLLAHALVEVSGFPVASPADARSIIRMVPSALRWRIWVAYRGNCPADRYYSTKGLFAAPDYTAHHQRIIADDDSADEEVDEAVAQLERKFGKAEIQEVREMEQRIIADAIANRTGGKRG